MPIFDAGWRERKVVEAESERADKRGLSSWLVLGLRKVIGAVSWTLDTARDARTTAILAIACTSLMILKDGLEAFSSRNFWMAALHFCGAYGGVLACFKIAKYRKPA